MEFHDRKIMIEEVKTLPRGLVNRLSTNDQKSMYKMPPLINNVRSRLPKALTDKQHSVQNISSTFPNAIIPKKKNIALSSDSISRGMEVKQLNS